MLVRVYATRHELLVSWQATQPALGMVCRAIVDMLRALGPRLQRLSACAGTSFADGDNSDVLVPAILAHCPVLADLAVEKLGPGTNAAVCLMTMAR